jgi:hypothetical protein
MTELAQKNRLQLRLRESRTSASWLNMNKKVSTGVSIGDGDESR